MAENDNNLINKLFLERNKCILANISLLIKKNSLLLNQYLK